MGEYYAYIIGNDGHVTGRVDVIAQDDALAKRLARQLVDGRAVELWQGARRIERIEPENLGKLVEGPAAKIDLGMSADQMP